MRTNPSSSKLLFQHRLSSKVAKQMSAALLAVSIFSLAGLGAAGAAQIHWSGAAGDRDWTDATNWDGGVVPGAGDGVLFDNTDAQNDFLTNSAAFSTNNFIGTSFTISNLVYSNFTYSATPPFVSQHTEIKGGATLTVTNGLVVGVSRTDGKGFPSASGTVVQTYATISGAGTLSLTGGNVNIGYQSSESASAYVDGILDMYNLQNFSFVSTNGMFGIAAAQHRRSGGEVSMAVTNLITTSNFWVGFGVTGVGAHAGVLHLGQVNVFNTFNFTCGRDNEGDINFAPGLTNPTVVIRGRDGVGAFSSAVFGYTDSISSSFGNGTNDFTAGVIDLKSTNVYVAYNVGEVSGSTQSTIDSLLIGPSTNNSIVTRNVFVGSAPGDNLAAGYTKTIRAFGLIDMQGGTFVCSNVIAGSAVNAGTGNGTISLHGGTFIATNISLGTSITNGIAHGTLALDGGIMRIANNITVGSNPNGTAISEIDVTNATFGVGGQVGVASSNLSFITLSGAILELGLGGSTNVGIYTTNLDVEAPSTIRITSTNLALGQYPIIAAQSITGSNGFAGLSLSLPAGVSASLVNNTSQSTIDLLVTVVPVQVARPVLTAITSTGGNVYTLTGTGTANQPYSVYSTTNLTPPITWTLLGATNASGSGAIQYTIQATNTQSFYRLSR